MSPPAAAPAYEFEWPTSPDGNRRSPPSTIMGDFSPPLIAMVAVVGTALLIVVYFRLISRYLLPALFRRLRRCRLLRSRSFYDYRSDVESQSAPFETAFQFLSPYGLDEAAIKTLPLSMYTEKRRRSASADCRDCAVCLLEFEQNDCVRTLPACSHAFHVDCIDAWLRSHANCPLCRAGIFRRAEPPFAPLMAARIRPSLDDGILSGMLLDPLGSETLAPEILPIDPSPRRDAEDRDRRLDGRDFLLKRSYSFGFERGLTADPLALDVATATPWRYRRCGLWSAKRPSPFKTRVFSFRSCRGSITKSPFLRRRGFFPLSESSVRFASVDSSRRSKSMASPWFGTSRTRCGDPEALLSPERLK